MRHAAKIDANQPEIVRALRKVGAFVEPKIARVGEGVPDLLVYFRGWHVLEIKDGSLSPSRRRLTPKERGWALAASLAGGRVPVVCNVTDALRAIGAIP